MASKPVSQSVPGQVFVFNVYSEDMTLFSVNGTPTAAALGWPQPGQEAAGDMPFSPHGFTVPRVLNRSDGAGKFYKGRNEIVVQWLENPQWFSITVTQPMLANLVLYVTGTAFVFMNTDGSLISLGSLVPSPPT